MNIVKRLYPESVARDEQFAFCLVPDGEGKHTSKVFHACCTILFIKMQDCLGVAVGAVDVSALFEEGAEVGMIIDLTVVGDLKRAVFVCHRLMTGRDINNTQAPMPQPNAVVNEQALIIRPTVMNYIAHSLKHANV